MVMGRISVHEVEATSRCVSGEKRLDNEKKQDDRALFLLIDLSVNSRSKGHYSQEHAYGGCLRWCT